VRGSLVTLVSLLFLGAALPAQAARHELGLRLRAFERHLDQVDEAARRDAAFVALDDAVKAFFALDLPKVARLVDAADRALSGEAFSPQQLFARSLQLTLKDRLVDVSEGRVEAELSALYDVADDDIDVEGLAIVLQLPGMNRAQRVALDELPMTFELTFGGLAAGDHELRWSIVDADADELVARTQGLSVAEDVDARIRALADFAAARGGDAASSLESETFEASVKLLQRMRRSMPYETVLDGHAMLAELEALRAWLAAPAAASFYSASRPGSFRLRVPVGRRNVATRLYVPKVDDGQRPLVIALHGAGGSENLFFDGYGDGAVVRLAAERGWFVASPRNGLGGVDCAGLARALGERYPIDLGEVFVVGHSMGAMRTVENACASPGTFRAVAALGGGGEVRPSDALKRLPFFVAAGDRDFLLQGARKLVRVLEAADVDVTWQPYAGVEHFAIVQVALPDVFAFFEQALERR